VNFYHSVSLLGKSSCTTVPESDSICLGVGLSITRPENVSRALSEVTNHSSSLIGSFFSILSNLRFIKFSFLFKIFHCHSYHMSIFFIKFKHIIWYLFVLIFFTLFFIIFYMILLRYVFFN